MTTGTSSLRLGVVGCGAVIELCHLPALAGGEPFQLTALIDHVPEHAERAAGHYRRLRAAKGLTAGPAPECVGDLVEVLDAIDVAIVATGPASHAALAAQLAMAGKHVLLEKPIATTTAECAEIRAAAAATGAVVVPAHVRRFFPAARWVAQRLASDWLGGVRRVRWREGAEYGWPALSRFVFDAGAGGGVLADLGPHVTDLLAHWFGPVELIGVEDNSAGGVDSEARLELRAGAVPVEVELSRLRDLDNIITIEGTRATLGVGTPRAASYRAWTSAGVELEQGSVPAPTPARLTREGLFHHQLVEFDRALRGRPSGAATFAEAATTVELLQRCRTQRAHRLLRPWEARRPARSRGVRRVAVTGATGFIGSHVVDRLLHDDATTVLALGRTPGKRARLSHWDSARLDFRLADMLDGPAALVDAFRGCDVVVHAAYGNRGEPAQRWAVSVDGTAAVLAAAGQAGVSRLVHVSSMSVYDPTVGPVINEECAPVPPEPGGLSYAQQKLAAERLVLASPDDRMEVVCVQPSVVYGPWGPLWTLRPLRRLPGDNAGLPSGAGGSCDVVHVHDVADAITFLASTPGTHGRRFLLSGPERATWGGFYDRYRDMLGLPRLRLADSVRWPERDRRFYAGSPPVDTSALAALGFRARIDLDEGMAQVAGWARWAGLT
ncbi:MAG: NAD-dependent epimerase/dehydratase family protein [Pseudonocardia sp.]